jgi:hypothetical protein
MFPLTLNLNAACRVTLTDAGRRWYREHYTALGIERFIPDPIPEEFTLWELMHVFGPHVYNGCVEIPFVDNQIELLDPRT